MTISVLTVSKLDIQRRPFLSGTNVASTNRESALGIPLQISPRVLIPPLSISLWVRLRALRQPSGRPRIRISSFVYSFAWPVLQNRRSFSISLLEYFVTSTVRHPPISAPDSLRCTLSVSPILFLAALIRSEIALPRRPLILIFPDDNYPANRGVSPGPGRLATPIVLLAKSVAEIRLIQRVLLTNRRLIPIF